MPPLTPLPLQGHPLIPVLQVAVESAHVPADVDLRLAGAQNEWPEQLLNLISRVTMGLYAPKLDQVGNVDFQITRGLLGVSM